MNKIIIPFLITFFAGISTVIGIIPIYFNKKYKDNIINFSLALAAGVMISVSIISLLPEALKYLNSYLNFTSILIILIFINIGIIVSMFIDKKISKSDNNSLHKVGLIGLITLILHNIPEGITTFFTSTNDIRIGLFLGVAIALHNIPEGISIAVPIYYSTNSSKLAFLYTMVAGFSEFFGAILAYLFFKNYINNFIMALVLGITIGVMIQISCYELLPTALKYRKYFISFLGLFLGFFIIVICTFIFKI